jgi:ribonuclease HI
VVYLFYMQETIVMYTDGGSRGNPGPAALGVYIETLGEKYGEYTGIGTNNEAEYDAIISGMKKVRSLVGKSNAKRVTLNCFMDSELAVKQLNHEYKLKEPRIQQRFLEIWNLMLDFGAVNFTHVRREKNKVADAMVNEALDREVKQRKLL